MKRKYIHKAYNNNKKKFKNNKESSDDDEEEDNNINILSSVSKEIETIGNHIWFNDDITNLSMNKLIKLINTKNFYFKQFQTDTQYGKVYPNPLYLHINSNGGDLQSAMGAVDCIINSVIPIYTIIEGQAASAATFLSIVGKKRFMTEHSVLLIHQLSNFSSGKMNELEDQHTNNKFFMEKIYDLYTKYTKLSKKKLKSIMKHDIWWDKNDAIKYGFIDYIYTNDNDVEKLELENFF